MHVLDLVLYLAGAICLTLAALGVASARVNLLAAGLTLWILVPLIHAITSL